MKEVPSLMPIGKDHIGKVYAPAGNVLAQECYRLAYIGSAYLSARSLPHLEIPAGV